MDHQYNVPDPSSYSSTYEVNEREKPSLRAIDQCGSITTVGFITLLYWGGFFIIRLDSNWETIEHGPD